MDSNNDNKLSSDEYKYIYRVMDIDDDVQVSGQELLAWISSNLEYLCKPTPLAIKNPLPPLLPTTPT